MDRDTIDRAEKFKDGRLVAVRAPLAGAIRLRPMKGAPLFVDIDETVEEGQTLCLVMAMCVLSEVPYSGLDAIIVEILVKDDDEVKLGDPLFVVAPLRIKEL